MNGKGHEADKKEVFDFAFSDIATKILSNPIRNWIEFFQQSKGVATDSVNKSVMFDTDSLEHEKEMLSASKISTYGKSARYIETSFNASDYVLYYSKGRGIIAVGEILSDFVEKDIEEEEKFRKVKMIYPKNGSNYDEAVSPAEIKQIAGHDFFYASTIKSPFKDSTFAKKIIEKLKEKYDRLNRLK